MGDDNDDDNEGTSCCNEPQQAFVYLYAVYLVAVFLTWETIISKPMRLLATSIHEISHAIACMLTCGDVRAIEVYNNEGGVTKYVGGCRCIIVPAGYLGEAFWGMVFVVMSGGRKTSTAAASGLIIALLVCLCYSPNRVLVILNLTYAIITLIVIFIEWFAFTPILAFVVLLYGVFLGTYAIFDIFGHLILRSQPGSDAYALYEESGRIFPPRCVGVYWLLIAIVLQILGIWLTLILMSEECEDLGWFECIFDSKLELEGLEFDWWPDDWWPDDWDFKN